jgi:4-amino-4-deoxy-L-arabinose transferase-like glycosyltransferase
MGLSLELFTLVAVGFALLRRNAYDKMLLVYLLVTFVITSLSAVRFARYMIPLFPAMALLCGAFFCTAWQKQRAIAGTVTAVVLLLTTIYTLSLLRLMRDKPVQELAAEYINNHLPAGDSIAFPETPWFYSPAIVPAFGAVDPQVRSSLAQQESTRFVLRVPEQPWSTAVLSPSPGMVAVSNFETMHPLRLNQPGPRRFINALSTYTMTSFGPGTIWGEPPHGAIIPDDILYIMPTITLYVPHG